MPRRKGIRHRQQGSKRARLHYRQAEFAFGRRGRWMDHPSHVSFRWNRPYRRTRKNWSKLL